MNDTNNRVTVVSITLISLGKWSCCKGTVSVDTRIKCARVVLGDVRFSSDNVRTSLQVMFV